jgi:hypothetical protein
VIGGNLIIGLNNAQLIDVEANQVQHSILCPFDRPQPIGQGNTAHYIDPGCGPIGVATGGF